MILLNLICESLFPLDSSLRLRAVHQKGNLSLVSDELAETDSRFLSGLIIICLALADNQRILDSRVYGKYRHSVAVCQLQLGLSRIDIYKSDNQGVGTFIQHLVYDIYLFRNIPVSRRVIIQLYLLVSCESQRFVDVIHRLLRALMHLLPETAAGIFSNHRQADSRRKLNSFYRKIINSFRGNIKIVLKQCRFTLLCFCLSLLRLFAFCLLRRTLSLTLRQSLLRLLRRSIFGISGRASGQKSHHTQYRQNLFLHFVKIHTFP